MPQYLLSLHTTPDAGPEATAADGAEASAAAPPSPEDAAVDEAAASWAEIEALNAELRSAGAWVFGGALHGVDSATVVRAAGGEVVTTDGPFVETREQLAGFYIVDAPDLDAALSWAAKTAAAVRRPIEVRPFRDASAS